MSRTLYGNREEEMTSLKTLIDRLCEVVNRLTDAKQRREWQQELAIVYPLVYWTIDETSGKLRGTLR